MRVGRFIPIEPSQEPVLHRWIGLTKKLAPSLKETDYVRRFIDEKTGNARCTIKII